ncbi:Anaphase-promoting complex subunit 1 [Borealophlyctis nickersoniae]|nr:Anaphase-promoting complex subunit 1 [Borealophlyctis nickersoniae]
MQGLWEGVMHSQKPSNSPQSTAIENDGITKSRFAQDCRLHEAKAMLSPEPPTITLDGLDSRWVAVGLIGKKVTNAHFPATSEDFREDKQQEHLELLATRMFALSLGRAILTFGTGIPVPTEFFPLPSTEVCAKFTPGNTNVSLDVTRFPRFDQEAPEWADFHDGVAAGLRVPVDCADVDKTWIVFQRERADTNEDDSDDRYAGFLLGVGLTKHLSKLGRKEHLEYLREEHPFTSIGYLLGLGAAWVGSQDLRLSRVINLHLRSLSETNSEPSHVRSAAIVSLGLVYQGTVSRYNAERILSELGSLKLSDIESINWLRGSYATACGFALGFLILGKIKTPQAAGLAHMKIADVLLKHTAGVHAEITAPGATIALGLVYMKTNDQALADKLQLPTSSYVLERVRQDILLLRVLARNLIMWDQISPSKQWVVSQIPSYLKESAKKVDSLETAPGPESDIREAVWNIVAGSCFSIGLKFAGSMNLEARDVLLGYLDFFMRVAGTASGTLRGKGTRASARSCIDVIAVALGTVMAGTGDILAMRRLRKLHGRRLGRDLTYGSHMATHMALGFLFLGGGTCTLGTSNEAVAALVCSLCPRFPSHISDNRSHLQAFRHLWALAVERRCLVTRDVQTGEACCVPVEITLRAGARGKNMRRLNVTTPFLMPALETIKSIKIASPEYWPIEIDLADTQQRSHCLGNPWSVQRKAGFPGHSEEAAAVAPASLFHELLANDIRASDDLQEALSMHPQPRSFVECLDINVGSDHLPSGDDSPATICANILHECIAQDRVDMLSTYLWVYRIKQKLKRDPQVQDAWDLKLLLAFTKANAKEQEHLANPEALLSANLVRHLRKHVESVFASMERTPLSSGGPTLNDVLRHYLKHGDYTQILPPGPVRHLVATYLVYFGWPGPKDLQRTGISGSDAGRAGAVILGRLLRELKGVPATTISKIFAILREE